LKKGNNGRRYALGWAPTQIGLRDKSLTGTRGFSEGDWGESSGEKKSLMQRIWRKGVAKGGIKLTPTPLTVGDQKIIEKCLNALF